MTKRDIVIRTIAATIISLGAVSAWWRLLGAGPTLGRIVPSILIVAAAFAIGTAGGRRVARGTGALLGLAATFVAGLILGAMTLPNAAGNVSPGALVSGVVQGLGILLRSPVPAPTNSETVTAVIVYSGYFTVVACLLICTKAPATALIPAFALFLGATALSQGSLASATVSGFIFVFAALIALYLVPSGGRSGAITDGVEFAEPQRSPSQGKLVHGITVAIVSVIIASVAAFAALTSNIGSMNKPFDPHLTQNYRPQTTIDPITQVGNWQSIARDQAIPLINIIGDDLPTALSWSAEETYTGGGWATIDSYDNVENPLPYNGPDQSMTRTVSTLTETLSGLPGPWLPTVPLPVTMGGIQIRMNQDGGVISRSDVAANLKYGATSQYLALRNLNTLKKANATQNGYSANTDLPQGFPDGLKEFANIAMSVGNTDYEELNNLAQALSGKGFRLDNSAIGDLLSYNAINTFVTKTKVGTQAQFATAFALMARTRHFPTRLVAGFATPNSKGGNITSQQAIVWPEVKFQGIGWVAFAPAPGDVSHGVPVPTTYTPPPNPPAPPPPPPQPQVEESGGFPVWILVVIGLAVIGTVGWAIMIRRRRSQLYSQLHDPDYSAFGPWVWAVSVRRHLRSAAPHSPASAAAGQPLDPPAMSSSMLLRKLSAKSADVAPPTELPSSGLAELARIAVPALYGPSGASADDLARGWTLADADCKSVRSKSGFTGLLRWTFIPIRTFEHVEE